MARQPGLGNRERHPRDPFAVDREHALDAIRLDWGSRYVLGADLNGMWWGLRRDGRPGVSAGSPDALLAAITEDHREHPVVIP